MKIKRIPRDHGWSLRYIPGSRRSINTNSSAKKTSMTANRTWQQWILMRSATNHTTIPPVISPASSTPSVPARNISAMW